MTLEQAQAMVASVVGSAPGPVSVCVADDHGEIGVSGLPGEEDERLDRTAIESAGLTHR